MPENKQKEERVAARNFMIKVFLEPCITDDRGNFFSARRQQGARSKILMSGNFNKESLGYLQSFLDEGIPKESSPLHDAP